MEAVEAVLSHVNRDEESLLPSHTALPTSLGSAALSVLRVCFSGVCFGVLQCRGTQCLPGNCWISL